MDKKRVVQMLEFTKTSLNVENCKNDAFVVYGHSISLDNANHMGTKLSARGTCACCPSFRTIQLVNSS